MKRVEGGEFGPFANLVSDVDFSPVEPILAFTSHGKDTSVRHADVPTDLRSD